MTIAPSNGFNSTLPWPEGTLEDWQHGASYGWLEEKYGKSYSAVSKLCRKAEVMGAKRIVDLAKKRRGGGTRKYADQKPLSPIHRTLGLKLQDLRGYGTDQISYKELGNQLSVSHLVARQMELGIHDFTLRQIQKLAELRKETVSSLLEPIKVRTNDRYPTTELPHRG